MRCDDVGFGACKQACRHIGYFVYGEYADDGSSDVRVGVCAACCNDGGVRPLFDRVSQPFDKGTAYAAGDKVCGVYCQDTRAACIECDCACRNVYRGGDMLGFRRRCGRAFVCVRRVYD